VEETRRAPGGPGVGGGGEGQPLFEELLHEYDGLHFKRPDGSLDVTTNVTRITNACLKYGFVPNNTKQTVNGFTLLPQDYLCPKSYEDGKIYLTENSMTIHHFAGSWVSDVDRYAQELGKKLTFLPESIRGYVAMFCSNVHCNGFAAACKEFVSWAKRKADL